MLSAGQNIAFIMVPAFLPGMESAKKAKAAKAAKLLWRPVLFRRSDSECIICLKVWNAMMLMQTSNVDPHSWVQLL